MTRKMAAYKVFTHDLRPSIEGGETLWPGSLPFQLPRIAVDMSDFPYEKGWECSPMWEPWMYGRGWNAFPTAEIALCNGGLWPDGYPGRLFRLETDEPVVSIHEQMRAATWTVTEELPVDCAVHALSREWYGDDNVAGTDLVNEMAREQLAWYNALARPYRDPVAVEIALQQALTARGLSWPLSRLDSPQAVKIAWEAWLDKNIVQVGETRPDFKDPARFGAWDAREAWSGEWEDPDDDASHAWDAMRGCDTGGRSAAWDARRALEHYFHARRWPDDDDCSQPPDRFTVGIRDAYVHGLGIALPTAPGQLSWAMEP